MDSNSLCEDSFIFYNMGRFKVNQIIRVLLSGLYVLLCSVKDHPYLSLQSGQGKRRKPIKRFPIHLLWLMKVESCVQC